MRVSLSANQSSPFWICIVRKFSFDDEVMKWWCSKHAMQKVLAGRRVVRVLLRSSLDQRRIDRFVRTLLARWPTVVVKLLPHFTHEQQFPAGGVTGGNEGERLVSCPVLVSGVNNSTWSRFTIYQVIVTFKCSLTSDEGKKNNHHTTYR